MGPTPILPPIRAVPFVFEANVAASRRLRVGPGRPQGTNPRGLCIPWLACVHTPLLAKVTKRVESVGDAVCREENLVRGLSIIQRVLRRLIAAGRATTISGHHFFMYGEVINKFMWHEAT